MSEVAIESRFTEASWGTLTAKLSKRRHSGFCCLSAPLATRRRPVASRSGHPPRDAIDAVLLTTDEQSVRLTKPASDMQPLDHGRALGPRKSWGLDGRRRLQQIED